MARKHKPSFRRNADAVVSDATVSAPSCVPPTPASEANTSVSTSEPAVVVQPLPPLPTPMTAWQLCGDTVIGFAHRRKGLPCQDAVAFRQSQRPILALSDGAGSAAISERGAQALVIGVIVDLRCDIAGWERWHWHYAAQQTGTAERFLLMASFAASAPDSSVIKKAEAQIATLERKARAARAEMVPYRQGRKPGAVNRLTRALMAVVKEAGSSEYFAVIAYLDGAYDDEFEGIIFRDIVNDRLEYSDLSKNRETSIAIDTLKRKLQQLPDV